LAEFVGRWADHLVEGDGAEGGSAGRVGMALRVSSFRLQSLLLKFDHSTPIKTSANQVD
jgi:hypothetical protein